LSPESEEEDEYGDEDVDNGAAYPAHGRKGGVPEKGADDDD
jgi:tubulin polyglutamylase TTLL6/13